MAATQTNGNPKVQYDPTFTDAVIAATGPKADPRLREVMTALIRHVHDFAREVNLTTDEYMAGVQMLNWAGQMRFVVPDHLSVRQRERVLLRTNGTAWMMQHRPPQRRPAPH